MDNWLVKLQQRAERTFGAVPIGEVIGRTKAIIGLATLPAEEVDAQSALTKLQNGQVPSAKEVTALALMVRLMRPAPLSQHGELAQLPKQNQYNADLVAAWETFRPLVRDYLYSIGRLDRVDGESVGTGFLVGEDLLVTNRHVLEALSYGGRQLEEGQAVVCFKQEVDCLDDEGPLPVLGVTAIHATLDMALLRIRKPAGRIAVPLQFDARPVQPGDRVVTIGYPFEDSERNPIFVPHIFENHDGVKRAAPGEVVGVAPPEFHHDCSTLGGNSGSPVLSITNARVVGLHRSGFFMYQNEAVDAASLATFIHNHLD